MQPQETWLILTETEVRKLPLLTINEYGVMRLIALTLQVSKN